MIEFSVSAIVVICAKSLIFKSYAGTVRKQSKAACGFLAFMPAENSFHCQCCKLKTMFTGGDFHQHRTVLRKDMMLYKQVIQE